MIGSWVGFGPNEYHYFIGNLILIHLISAIGLQLLIGFTGLKQVNLDEPFTPAVEIGWRLLPEHWGMGYATEAAQASLDYVFGTLGWQSVIHAILVGNTASVAVAEKLGSKLIRTQRGLAGVTDDEVMIYGQDA